MRTITYKKQTLRIAKKEDFYRNDGTYKVGLKYWVKSLLFELMDPYVVKDDFSITTVLEWLEYNRVYVLL